MKVKIESEVTQSCPTLSDPMDCSQSGSSVHGIFQARVLEWGAITFSQCLGYLEPKENLKGCEAGLGTLCVLQCTSLHRSFPEVGR